MPAQTQIYQVRAKPKTEVLNLSQKEKDKNENSKRVLIVYKKEKLNNDFIRDVNCG